MEFDEIHDIDQAASFILSGNFTRVALQFPDELLKDSTRVVGALGRKLKELRECNPVNGEIKDGKEIRLFIMADTTYGNCCVDEAGASHVDADCVIHYGHTCLSPTSKLPAFFVFGKASIDVTNCVETLSSFASTSSKSVVVLFGLEYSYSIPRIKEEVASSAPPWFNHGSKFHFADVMCPAINPSKDPEDFVELQRPADHSIPCDNTHVAGGSRHSIGGLIWVLPDGKRMEDCLLLWIGSENSAFANVVLTFNSCDIVRYDTKESHLVTDLSQQRRILKRRYYLVEKAKDANMVGILVGTLGAAGYLKMINRMKDLVAAAGKKSYTLVMGRPNPAKLANFPECDVFIYVSCAQTALLDSKEFLAPIITPFEAMLAFNRGSQWTGAYVITFQDLMISNPVEINNHSEEARFSLVEGRYVEDFESSENNIEERNQGVLTITNATEKALQLRDRSCDSVIKGTAKSGAEFFAARSYQGLEMNNGNSLPEPYLIGRTGKASGYEHEKPGR
ncbi:hypothetical protein K2173_017212 [Erythroxylum novogranatense]|uniref:2-(3-amino-3-carboxypropyl)histidine synthase subunit 2 n=1 Tax=Erythroxylum novogranatense TaxID=1862640 RepID=A0AAV8U793_9ROSI|nr:hypothetical protein K2173_017212 [Erythroxylum novogranatense]